MRVCISGSTGLVGQALVTELVQRGCEVAAVRRTIGSCDSGDVYWNVADQTLDVAALEGFDAVVHLAGESVFGRWTAPKKDRIRESRVRGTELLAKSIAQLQRPPKVVIAASAVGFYGDRGAEVLDESSASGSGFLAEVSREWEGAWSALDTLGTRVCILRLGVVLSTYGGALKQMRMPLGAAVAGPVGSGEQYMSWISIVDVVGATLHLMLHEECSGIFNLVGPNPVTASEFSLILGRVMRRPVLPNMPAVLARMVFGEMVDQLLLASVRVVPRELSKVGYRFQYPELDSALEHLLVEGL